ncbi:MAG: hypothetical protein JW986_10980 [Methanotrichaceae archaeon]|nr:hypothetical protein [Methanotrichaceae archaeon]
MHRIGFGLCILFLLPLASALDAGSGSMFMMDSSSPWFSSETSFGYNFSEGFEGVFSSYREYYYESGPAVEGGLISIPVRFDISGHEPSQIYFGSTQPITYGNYRQSYTTSNDLWIDGGNSWRRSIVCPLGTWIRLVADVSEGGMADFYGIEQTPPDQISVFRHQYSFFQGFNRMSFHAGSVGRHILLFIKDDQPSNVVIVDVAASTIGDRELDMPPAEFDHSTSPAGFYGSTSSTVVQQATTTTHTPGLSAGDARAILKSPMKGYDIYLDGQLIGKEGTAGDALDGEYSFNLRGGMNHDVKIFDGQFFYGKVMNFAPGETKEIYVPQGIAVYV